MHRLDFLNHFTCRMTCSSLLRNMSTTETSPKSLMIERQQENSADGDRYGRGRDLFEFDLTRASTREGYQAWNL